MLNSCFFKKNRSFLLILTFLVFEHFLGFVSVVLFINQGELKGSQAFFMDTLTSFTTLEIDLKLTPLLVDVAWNEK